MTDNIGCIVLAVDDGIPVLWYSGAGILVDMPRAEAMGVWGLALPDLDDDATAGLLPAMVREALGCPAAQASPWTIGPHTVTRWRVCLNDEADREFPGATEIEAWIVAMEAR